MGRYNLRAAAAKLLGRHLDFRVRLFNVLAAAGFLISAAMMVFSILTQGGWVQVCVNALCALLSVGLLYYSYRSGKYQRCYIITIVLIFLGLFPALFFSGGGYHSGMPLFFIFAIVFTAFMLQGPAVYIMTGLELAVYTALCLIAYYYPDTVSMLDEQELMMDVVICMVTVSVALGVTMILHFRLYNEQQAQLQRAREEAIGLSNAKTAFLANMSHEIRTPINVITGMNEMILRESSSEQVLGFAGKVQDAGKTLLTLVNNVLDVSKIESGRVDCIEEYYEARDLIRELSVIGMERAQKKGLSFTVIVEGEIPSALYGDYIHIKQIAINFISNAVKYTQKGSVRLSFGGGARGEDEYLLRVSVSDTGPGIKQEHQSYLFDAFARLDSPGQRNIEGTGLGLTIAKQLAALLGGSITLDSTWGEGSTFHLEVLQKVHSALPMGTWSVEDAQADDDHAGRFIAPEVSVLVVDDNLDNQQVIKALLGHTLMRVDTADGGRECIEMLSGRTYHAILMDYMMPELDGLETFKLIQQTYPGFETPVIALTANTVSGVAKMLVDEGFAACLNKPVMWRTLEDALLRFLPKESIISSAADKRQHIPQNLQDQFEKTLGESGIFLQDGLRYLSGDLHQYKKLGEFFVENYQHNVEQVCALAGRQAWGELLFPVHSLKSRARAVGASGLHNMAAYLERQCALGNAQRIEQALPLLLQEWESTAQGLRAFTAEFDAAVQVEPVSSDARPDEEALLGHIRAYRRKESEEQLGGLIAAADGALAGVLTQAKEAVAELEFERAEQIMLEYIRHRGGEGA